MVPWPIGILTLFYGVLATISAANVWHVLCGTSQQSMVWPLAWFVGSMAITCGLPLLKPWARWLAIAGSVVMIMISLVMADLLARSGHPWPAMAATLGAGVHLVIIRYLRRPTIKTFFGSGHGANLLR